jgi:hypothetical protein
LRVYLLAPTFLSLPDNFEKDPQFLAASPEDQADFRKNLPQIKQTFKELVDGLVKIQQTFAAGGKQLTDFSKDPNAPKDNPMKGVKSLSASPVEEGGITLPNPDGSLPPGAFTAAGQEKLNKMVGDKMNASANGKDLGNGFTLTTTNYDGQNYPAVLDTQDKIYWLERTDNIHTIGFGSHIKIENGKATAGIPGKQTLAAMKTAGWNVPEPRQREPEPAPAPAGPFVPTDYKTKEPLTKGPDGKWYNKAGEERDNLHGGPIGPGGGAMFRSLTPRAAPTPAAVPESAELTAMLRIAGLR